MGAQLSKVGDSHEINELLNSEDCSLEKVKNEIKISKGLDLLESNLESEIEYEYFWECFSRVLSTLSEPSFYDDFGVEKIQQISNRVSTATSLQELPEELLNIKYLNLMVSESSLLCEQDINFYLRKIRFILLATIENIQFPELLKTDKALQIYSQILKEYLLQVKCIVSNQIGKEPNPEKWESFKERNCSAFEEYEKLFEKHKNDLQNYVTSKLAGVTDRALDSIRKDLVTELSKSLECEVERNHEKCTLVFKKPFVLMSDIITEIESRLKSSEEEIEEVHIIASEVIFIDCNLKNELWHGINIVLVSSKIECIVPKVVWDVSGLCGKGYVETDSPAKSGEIFGEDGQDGEDGCPGESGGNGLFIADIYVHMERFTFRTCGGDGGGGQNGGNGFEGESGEDGVGWTHRELDMKFPSPARFNKVEMHNALTECFHNLRTLKKETITVDDQSGMNWRSSTLERFGTKSCHVTGYTEDERQIEFCYYEGFAPFSTRQTYVLVRGPPGTSGKPGGRKGIGGAGGKGGFPGTVKVITRSGKSVRFDDNIVADYGKDKKNGDNGKNGARGRNGSNGLDVGRMDYLTRSTVQMGPATLIVENCENIGNCCWSEYYKSYRVIKKVAAGPSQLLSLNMQQLFDQLTTKQKVPAQRKNAINEEQLLQIHTNTSSASEIEETEAVSVSTMRDTPASSDFMQLPPNRKQYAEMKKIPKNILKPNNMELTKKRIEAFQSICEKNKVQWKLFRCPKMTFKSRPLFSQDSNSAIECLFADTENINKFDSALKRDEVCEHLKPKIPFENDSKAEDLWKSSLVFFFVFQNRNSEKSGESSTSKLDNFGQLYKLNGDNFNWEDVLTNREALQEYADYLKNPSIPFLESDLLLIAHVYGLHVKLYRWDETQKIYCEMKQKNNHVANETDNLSTIHIAVGKTRKFTRLEHILKIDTREERHIIKNIFSQVFDFTEANEISKYLDNCPDLLHHQTDKQEAKESKTFEQYIWDKEKVSFDKKYDLVSEISKVLCKKLTENDDEINEMLEKHVIETTLQLLPWNILQIFYCRILTVEKENESNIYFAAEEIQERLLAREDITHLLWIIASYPVSMWAHQFTVAILNEHFELETAQHVVNMEILLTDFPPNFVELIGKTVRKKTFDSGETQVFIKWLKDLSTFPLHKSMDFSKLEEISISEWPFQLNCLYLKYRLQNLPNVTWNENSNKQERSLYYLCALHNENSSGILKLLDILVEKLSNEENCEYITKILESLYGGLWSLDEATILKISDASFTLYKWKQWIDTAMEGKVEPRSLSEICHLIEADPNTTPACKEYAKELARLMETTESPCFQAIIYGISKWVKEFRVKVRAKTLTLKEQMEYQLEAVNMVDFMIQNTTPQNFQLKPTQKITILMALKYHTVGKNLISQVSTGEGKTFIVLAVAIVRGLFGEKTDVVTSSSVLAKRDATAYTEIYQAFGLKVGCNSSDVLSERRKAYSCTVCYGDISSFQRDYLLDRFYSQNIRGDRGHQNVIVDEVDSMFLDKGNNVLYLSHQIPDLNTLESVFVAIWVNVAQAVFDTGNCDVLKLHEKILSLVYPTVGLKDLELILADSNKEKLEELKKYLVDSKIICSKGRIIKSAEKINKIIEYPDPFKSCKNRLNYLLLKKLNRDSRIPVKPHLQSFIEQHLLTWIKSAVQACFLQEGIEYVVDTGHSKTSPIKNPQIIILDLDTGTDLRDSQWSQGLHQFLQLKHGCQLTPLSMKAVYISNISYFKLYSRIFGLTGTIGTNSDRNFLKETYQVELMCVPLAIPKRFKEIPPEICKNRLDWAENITNEAEEYVKKERSVLIICSSVFEAEYIYRHMVKALPRRKQKIEIYRRDYEEFRATRISKGLPPGHIIIATNLAGRGTDIRLSIDLREAGGLHVILSYLPDNLRVEQQAFGRASRSGDPGSGRLIFMRCASKTSGNAQKIDAIELKMLRDETEMRRVSSIKAYYKNVIVKEEEMFNLFGDRFDEVRTGLTALHGTILNHIFVHISKAGKEENFKKLLKAELESAKDLILYSMLDDWVFWLDLYSSYLHKKIGENSEHGYFDHACESDDDEMKLKTEFVAFTGEYKISVLKFLEKSAFKTIIHMNPSFLLIQTAFAFFSSEGYANYPVDLIKEPALIIKLAKYMIQSGNVKDGEKYLDKVLSKDGENLVALYYKIVCKLKNEQWKNSDFYKLLDKVEEKLEESKCREIAYASAIENLKGLGNSIFVGDSYKKQKERMLQILEMHSSSLRAITGSKFLSPQDFSGICNEQVGEHLLKHLIKVEKAVKESSFVKAYDKNVKQLASDFIMDTEKLQKILEPFEGEDLTPEIENDLEKQLGLASRPGFWEEIESCLENVQCFAVIQPENVMNADNQKKTTEQNDFLEWTKTSKSKYFVKKYGLNLAPESRMKLIKGKNEEEFLKQREFKWLRKCGRLNFEWCAFINEQRFKEIELGKFWKVEKTDFIFIDGLTQQDSINIYELLGNAQIINGENGELISAEKWKEKKPELKKYEVFREDICGILVQKCSYKYEYLCLLDEINKSKNEDILEEQSDSDEHTLNETKDNVKSEKDNTGSTGPEKSSCVNSTEFEIKLPPRPIKDFLISAMKHGILNGRKANPKYFQDQESVSAISADILKNSLPGIIIQDICEEVGLTDKHLPKICYDDMRCVFDDEEKTICQELWREIGTRGWLKLKPIGTKDDEIFTSKYYIDEENVKKTKLNEKFLFYEEELLDLFQFRCELAKENFMKEAISRVKKSQGILKTLERPDSGLETLESVFGDGNAGRQELAKFKDEIFIVTLNGFEHTISPFERKYTWKMIFSASVVAVIGTAQILVGAYLFIIGCVTFGAAFIAEGIGDLIYASRAFYSGYFSWKDWATHKVSSLAITAMIFLVLTPIQKFTMKYGQRALTILGETLFGIEATTTAATTTTSATQPTLLKQVGKAFGYKMLQATALVSSNTLASMFYERALISAVDKFCAQFFDGTHLAFENHPLNEETKELLDLEGPEKANALLKDFKSRALRETLAARGENYSISTILQALLAPSIIGASAATRKYISNMNISWFNTNSENASYGVLVAKFLIQNANIILNGIRHVDKIKKDLTKFRDDYWSNIYNKIQKYKRKSEVSKAREEKVGKVSGVVQDKSVETSENQKEQIIWQLVEDTCDMLRDELASIIRHEIIEPLISQLCQFLLDKAGHFIQGKYRMYKVRKYVEEIESIQNEIRNQNISAREAEVKKKNKQKLLTKFRKLVSKSRDPKLVAYAIENGCPLGAEAIQAYCNMKNVNIVVKIAGSDEVIFFQSGNGTSAQATLTINLDPASDDFIGHFYGTSGESKSEAESNPDCLLNTLNELNETGQPVSRKDIADFMRSDKNIGQFIRTGVNQIYNEQGIYGGLAQDKPKYTFEYAVVTDTEEKEYIDSLINDTEGLEQMVERNCHCFDFDLANNSDPDDIHFRLCQDPEGCDPNFEFGSVIRYATQELRIPGTNQTQQYAAYVEALITHGSGQKECPKNVKNQTMKGLRSREGFQWGHLIAYSLGGPPTIFNGIIQDEKVNMGPDQSLVKHMNTFLDENPLDGEVRLVQKVIYKDGYVVPTAYVARVEFREALELIENDKYSTLHVCMHNDRTKFGYLM